MTARLSSLLLALMALAFATECKDSSTGWYCFDMTIGEHTQNRVMCSRSLEACETSLPIAIKSSDRYLERAGAQSGTTSPGCVRFTGEVFCGRNQAGEHCSGIEEMCRLTVENPPAVTKRTCRKISWRENP